jgi:hypothetical protein
MVYLPIRNLNNAISVTSRTHLPESCAGVAPVKIRLRLTGLCLDRVASVAFGKVGMFSSLD